MYDTGVAFFNYCRPAYTRRSLESLKKNSFKKVYIFQDGPKPETDMCAYDEVTDIINSCALPDYEFIKHEANIGLAESIITGIGYVLERHETIVTLEDDVELSPIYSKFAEACFKKYRDDNEIFGICGSCYPILNSDAITDLSYDVFGLYGLSSHAWGTWRGRWKLFNRDITVLRRIMQDESKKKIVKLAGEQLLPVVYAGLEGRVDSWTMWAALIQIDNKALTVVPIKNLCSNFGYEGVGTNNTSLNRRFIADIENINNDNWRLPEKLEADINIHHYFNNMYMGSFRSREEKEDTYRMWTKLLVSGHTLAESLLKSGVDEVCIYGDGETAKYLIDELKNKVTVKCVIVEIKSTEDFCNLPLLEIDEINLLPTETVIVTPSYDFEYISHRLLKKFPQSKIRSITQMLRKELEKV